MSGKRSGFLALLAVLGGFLAGARRRRGVRPGPRASRAPATPPGGDRPAAATSTPPETATPPETDGPDVADTSGPDVELAGIEWWPVLKRTVVGFRDDNGQDNAAALTYYAVLAMFPAFIALVALLGVVGRESTVTTLVDIVQEIGSEQAAEAFRGPAQSAVSERGGAGALLGIGVVAALWAASGYIGAFTRATNNIWAVEESRPFWKLKPLQLAITLVVVMGAALLATALTLTGSVAFQIGETIGVGSTAVWIWQIAKWPVMLIVFALIVALLYRATPNLDHRRFRFLSPGAGLAVVVWLVASAGFAVYVANLGSYGATYGSLGGVIVLILWLWITNIALLLGARLDAAVAELQNGHEPL